MKQVTEFLWIQAELSAKLVDNSINSAEFWIFEIFMFLARLNCVSTEFSQILLNFFEFLKNQWGPRIRFLYSRQIC
jgi:hypothetical protein